MSKGNSEAPFSFTFRNTGDYDAYLFTVRGDTADELESRLDDVVEDLLQKAEDVARLAQAVHVATEPTDEVGKKREEKKSSKGSKLRRCEHGVRTKRTGKNSRGTWVGYFCPLEKGDPEQCDPEWQDDE